jgi:hypothetical protein
MILLTTAAAAVVVDALSFTIVVLRWRMMMRMMMMRMVMTRLLVIVACSCLRNLTAQSGRPAVVIVIRVARLTGHVIRVLRGESTSVLGIDSAARHDRDE